MKRSRSSSPRPTRPSQANRDPLAAGCEIRDVRNSQNGVILDHACQYAHPKADPVFNYLVRWEDGQVQAIAEAALTGGNGFEVVEKRAPRPVARATPAERSRTDRPRKTD